MIQYATYAVGFAMRVLSIVPFLGNELGLSWYAFAVFLFYIRSLRLFAGSETLGPKLLMLRRMFSDLLEFSLLLGILVLAWGVFTSALLTPPEAILSVSDWADAIVYKPFLYVFGDFDLTEDFESARMQLGFATKTCLMLLKAAQMIACNLMLVNVLTAMFASTYDEVQKDARENWQILFFELLNEYNDRPYIPGIFAYFDVVPRMLGNPGALFSKDLRAYSLEYDIDKRNRLEHFQEVQTDQYIERLEAEAQETHEAKIEQIATECRVMAAHLKEIQSHNTRQASEQSSTQTGSFFPTNTLNESGDTSSPHRKAQSRWKPRVPNQWASLKLEMADKPRTLSSNYPIFDRSFLLIDSVHVISELKYLIDLPEHTKKLANGQEAVRFGLFVCFVLRVDHSQR